MSVRLLTSVAVSGRTDRPGPPRNVRILSCTMDIIEVSWEPGTDGNSPIIEYIVYQTDQKSEDPNLLTEVNRVSASARLTTVVTSRPWTTFSFYIVARNALGSSNESSTASDGKRATCSTPQAAPRRNPDGVCCRLVRPTQLVIVWEVSCSIHRGQGQGRSWADVAVEKLVTFQTTFIEHDLRQRY